MSSHTLVRHTRQAVIWGAALGALQFIWPTPPGVIVQGVVVGSLTALLAFGLSLVYKTNGIINFAQADLGVVPATIGLSLLRDWDWPYFVVLPATIMVAMALGSAVEFLVIRRFWKAPRLILSVATIGLAQLLLGVGFYIPTLFSDEDGMALLRFPRFNPPFDLTFEIDPIVFTANDLLAMIIVPVVIIGLVAFLNRTDLGTSVRASAQSRDRASLVGIDVRGTQNVVWVIAAVLATVGLLLRAGMFGFPLGPALGPAILLRALAAAVMGRMQNYSVMFAGATFLGVLETAIIWNEDTAALIDPALFVIVVGVLLFQRRARGRVRTEAEGSWVEVASIKKIPRQLASLPEVFWGGWLAKVVTVIFLLWLPTALDNSDTNFASAVMIYGVIAVSMVILTGWSGEISLGQMGFAAIGAATAAVVNFHFQWDLTLTLLLAGFFGAVASVIVGLPALRIRGLFLAVTTLAFSVATASFVLDEDRFTFLPDNIGERVTRLPLLGRIDVSSEHAFYYVCLAALIAVTWTVARLEATRTARVLRAARDNEDNAQAFGVNLTRTKLMAFAISGFYASLAGGLFTLHQQALGQGSFSPAESIRVLTMVVIGGLGSVPGALLGAVFLQGTEYFGDNLPADIRPLWLFASGGVGLLVVLMFLREGLGGLLYEVRRRLLAIVAFRRQIPVPSLFADQRIDDPTAADQTAGPGYSEPVAMVRSPRRDAKGVFRYLPSKQAPATDYFSFPDVIIGDDHDGSLLSVRSIDVSYGPVQVLFGVNLEFAQGDLVALLGTNGSGKSTVLRAISGLSVPSGGSVSLEGVDITTMAPHRIAALGIAQVPGGKGVFGSLTVAENIALGGWLHRRDKQQMERETARVFEMFPGLREKQNELAANLSGGQQQMLTLAMALMSKPRILLIDELSLGLAPVVVEQLLEVVQAMNDDGVTIVVVEQSVNLALTIADTAFFMEKGEVRFRGPTSDLLERDDVFRSVFLGGAATRASERRQPVRAPDGTEAAPRLEIEDLSKSFAGNRAVDRVSLRVGEGEIVGIVGPNGAGKTTVFDLISGLQNPDEGKVLLDGRDITHLSPDRRARLGLRHSFQDSRLFGSLTVEDALKVALDQTMATRDPIAAALGFPDVRRAEERLQQRVDELVGLLGLDAYREKFVSELSTGSRRIVDLACQAASAPRVILFDEPSSGIAQREAEALGPVLERIRDGTGASLLVIDHDMSVLASICDRMVALDLGSKVVEGAVAEVLENPEVIASYLGVSRSAIERSGIKRSGFDRSGGVPGGREPDVSRAT
ncbi:ATP-binding cassette domain-containing protein [Candidatus Poriferisocius sp.]|uniref:ATP-binding cassette domain-containing protein n=1 Tax=Candidatus Poriferisocius sp. TaxID=3101276 RepID=UPI003B519D33